ncbi:MAG: hypothetical protein ACYSX0_11070, partial [Planctomycetota bacterium]|jgi:hypothetical protein
VVLVTTRVGRLGGRRLEFQVAGTALRQDLHAIDTKEGTCLLILQDTLENGRGSPATEAMRTLMGETLDVVGLPADAPLK